MAYTPPDFEPNDLQLRGYLNLGSFLPGLSEAQQKLDDLQNNFVTPFLEEKQKAKDALFKRIDGLQQGLTDINAAVDGVQDVINTTDNLINDVGNLSGELANLIDTPGVYFYTYVGGSRNFTQAVAEDFKNGILTPDENGNLQPTDYGKNEVMAAVLLVLASDGGDFLDVGRILNVGTLYGQNFTDIANAYSNAVSAVDEAFNTYNVTYFSNGADSGTRPVDATNYEDDADSQAVVLGKNTLSLTGSTFQEWNTSPDGSGTSYQPGDIININSDISLYAQWS